MDEVFSSTIHKWLYNEPIENSPTLHILQASERLVQIRYAMENDAQKRLGAVRIYEEVSLNPDQPLLDIRAAEGKKSQLATLHIPKGNKEMMHIIRYIFKDWAETLSANNEYGFEYLPPITTVKNIISSIPSAYTFAYTLLATASVVPKEHMEISSISQQSSSDSDVVYGYFS